MKNTRIKIFKRYSGIGKRLKILRLKMGVSQKEVAKLMNVSRKTIGRWERKENVPQDICGQKLEELLNDWDKLINMSDKL